MAAHQAPPSLGFSRQEHWSGLPFPSPMHNPSRKEVLVHYVLFLCFDFFLVTIFFIQHKDHLGIALRPSHILTLECSLVPPSKMEGGYTICSSVCVVSMGVHNNSMFQFFFLSKFIALFGGQESPPTLTLPLCTISEFSNSLTGCSAIKWMAKFSFTFPWQPTCGIFL